LNPDDATAYNGMGNVFFDQKRYRKAIEAYNNAIERAPEETLFIRNRENALKYLRRAQ
jgi:tetratricopeptide (TPR) repeat protein